MSNGKHPRQTDELRDAIDRGEGGDKVAHPDPSAAPLGTDDEAGGSGPSPAAVRTAFDEEVRHTPGEGEPRGGVASRRLVVGIWAGVGLVLVVLLVILLSYGG